MSFATKDNPDLVLPIPSYEDVTKIDFDFRSGSIYWIESETKSIESAMEDGSNYHKIYDGRENRGNPYDLTVDSYAGSLYWTDSEADNINFLLFKGDKIPTVIFEKKKGYRPRNIAVSSEEGYVEVI